jgi:hypothetical protein
MKWGRMTLIILGAVTVTAFGIDAADTLRGEGGTMLAQLTGSGQKTGCPTGMQAVHNVPGIVCVDAYEASAGPECPTATPQSMLDTQRNFIVSECVTESQAERSPWRFVTRDQAMQLCARSGKRLPTSAEWYGLALGMVGTETCNTDTKSVSRTGDFADCVSPHGAYDLIGNVWEWVRDDVTDGAYNERALPSSGYVAQVDTHGMATMASDTPQELFGSDYVWTRMQGIYGVIRGGYYDSGSDAGVYSVHADTPPNSAAPGVGFRCVRDTL